MRPIITISQTGKPRLEGGRALTWLATLYSSNTHADPTRWLKLYGRGGCRGRDRQKARSLPHAGDRA